MTDPLTDLFERNRRHRDGLDADHFEGVRDGQSPRYVSMSCADSRVSQEGMLAVEGPGVLFTPSTIGNRVWQPVDGDLVVDGSVLYPIEHTGTETVIVVGHTGCGAITAALAAHRHDLDEPPGIRHDVELLSPVVEGAHEAGVVDPSMPESVAVNRLVEYNVDRQIDFLGDRREVPSDVDRYGMVYDFHRVYGEADGALVLVNANDETDPGRLREAVSDRFRDRVGRLTTR